MQSTVTVRYTSGRTETFRFEARDEISANRRLREMIENPTMVLRCGPKLVLIPGTAIESITVNASDEILDTLEIPAIRIAERISGEPS